ncbi:MAG: tetratricopeptide repeat protein, partial [Akkermansia muciniphila]|nr:tetratricopeptide repeat protein [Akkermansia muciniphila]
MKSIHYTASAILIGGILASCDNVAGPKAGVQSPTYRQAVAQYDAGNYAAALPGLRMAAYQGNPDALVKLGNCLEQGLGTEKNEYEAANCYSRAAGAGNAGAMNLLGNMYADGVGVSRDIRRALSLYETAAAKGDGAALNNLGTCYRRGEGVPQDE